MAIGLLPGKRSERRPYTRAYATTSGGQEQETRYHLAAAGGVHAVLQYRDPCESDWQVANQTVCGLREFVLCDPPGEWCEECYGVWRANR